MHSNVVKFPKQKQYRPNLTNLKLVEVPSLEEMVDKRKTERASLKLRNAFKFYPLTDFAEKEQIQSLFVCYEHHKESGALLEHHASEVLVHLKMLEKFVKYPHTLCARFRPQESSWRVN